MKELAYISASPYSSADFQHGPIAIVSRGFPVLAVSVQGKVHKNILAQLDYLHRKSQAELVVISNEKNALGLAQTPIQLPSGLPEWLSPIVAIVPAQLFSYHLARAKGFDVEKPRGLTKVTKTL